MTDQDDKDKIEVSFPPSDDDEVQEIDIEAHAAPAKKVAKKKSAQKKDKKKAEVQKELLEALIKERDEYKDNFLRNVADNENFRKRVKKEKEEFQKFVLGDFLLDLLTIVDNLDRALKANDPSGNDNSIVSGVEMIYKQLFDLLKKYNVEEIEALNKPFDPNLHQALSTEEKEDVSDPQVIEVYQKGFMYNGKLLRPALAKVAIPLEEEAPPEEEEAEEE
ncbi:MAG: nucleotide exchange factor GrpE [Candidatus Aminicenantes bacterium]|nr:nucleotide exchange factor GrpE [Candidatus Aminicenantes bacterium]